MTIKRRPRWVWGLVIVCVLGLLAFAVVILPQLGYASQEVTFFPTLRQESDMIPLAKVHGRLVLVNGCIRVRSLLPTYGFLFGSSSLVIWPYGYSAETQGNRIVVLDGGGEVAARVGDVIKGGGGVSHNREGVEASIGQLIPQECRGPYTALWIER
jgi:hypothetical protein